MNDIEKQLLEEFSTNLKDFVNNLHDSFGEDVYLGEDTKRQLDEINVREREFTAFFANRVDWLNKEIDDLKSKIAGETGAAKDFDQTRLDRLENLLKKQQANDVKRADEYKKKKQEIQKLTAEQKERIKDKVKEGFEKLNSYMAPAKLSTGLAHTQIIEALIEKYKNDMALAQTMYTRVSAKLNDPNERANSASLRKERNTLYSNIKKMAGVINSLTEFMAAYEELNDIYSNDNIFDNLSTVENCFYKFADALDAIEETVDYNLLTVNIKENPNGTFTVDMSCGYRFMEPPLILNREELTNDKINEYLRLFADRLATKSNFTVDNLLQSDVILKHNNDFVKKGDLKTICDAADKIRTGRLDNVMTNNGQQPAQPGDGNQPTGPDNGQQPAQPGDGNQSTGPDNGQQPTQPGDGNQPTGPDNGQQLTQPGDGQQEQNNQDDYDDNYDDNYDYSNRQNTQGSTLPELDAHAMKVNSKRNARSKFFNVLGRTALVAAVGLGLAGPTIGMGMLGATIAGGIGVIGTGYEAYVKIKENIKYGARKHKMKKLAKMMSKEANVDIVFDMNLETRKAGFKLRDDDKFLTSDDLRDPELFPEGMDDSILDIFENGVKGLNKYRGKGEGARTLKENRYKNFPTITFDNVSAAFNDFGGVKSWKELNDYQFDYNKIINARKEEQEEDILTNENDDVEEITPEQLEEMELALQQGDETPIQQQNSGEPETIQVQQQGDGSQQQQNPEQGQQQTQGNGGQNPVTNTELPPIELTDPGEFMVDQQKAQITDQASKIDEVMSQIQDSISTMDANDPNFKNDVMENVSNMLMACENELTVESRRQIVNKVNESIKFEPGHMEKFVLCIKDNRRKTDAELQATLQELTHPAFVESEQRLEQAINDAWDKFVSDRKEEYTNNIRNYTVQDLDRLAVLDGNKNFSEDNINALKSELEKIANNGRSL